MDVHSKWMFIQNGSTFKMEVQNLLFFEFVSTFAIGSIMNVKSI